MNESKPETAYSQCKAAIEGLEIGADRTIEMPENLIAFRRALIDLGGRNGKKFATKTIDGKLRIMRIKYFNISSNQME